MNRSTGCTDYELCPHYHSQSPCCDYATNAFWTAVELSALHPKTYRNPQNSKHWREINLSTRSHASVHAKLMCMSSTLHQVYGLHIFRACHLHHPQPVVERVLLPAMTLSATLWYETFILQRKAIFYHALHPPSRSFLLPELIKTTRRCPHTSVESTIPEFKLSLYLLYSRQRRLIHTEALGVASPYKLQAL